jgi:hypothetical protein
MQKVKSFGAAIAVASALFAISAPAHAQATRTWVAGVGDDLNPCSRTAPCKTFAGAISKTAIGGIMNCVDNGAYGAVTITKSITIDCHDAFASILANPDGVTGIIINVAAGDPKDTLRTVHLRNIDIAGVGAGKVGVAILSAASVILEDMSITGMTKQGIADTRTEGNTSLIVKNSILANNAGPGIAATATQSNSVVLDNVHSIKNSHGIAVAKSNTAVINRSEFSQNTTAGVEADASAQMTVDNSVISFNKNGVSGVGTIGLSNTDITFNGTGISGPSLSFGNNRLLGNGAPGMPPTPVGVSAPALGQQ